MDRFHKGLPDALAASAIALAVYAFFGHAFLNYDTFYSLLWGSDVAHGRTPQYDVPVAPTPHPLASAVGVLLSPLGDGAEEALLVLGLLAMGALCVGTFRLGQELYAWPVGLLAAAIVATRVPVLNFGIRGYVDLPTIALIVWAAVLEARRPRRGAAVLVLLGLAGLLRPEAWLFAAAYWVWLLPSQSRRGRLQLGALAAAAPMVWALSDLLVTGDPLWSLQGTRGLAAELERKTGLAALPEVVPFRLGEILRLPELVAAAVGFVAGIAYMRRRTLLPAAVAALNGVAFVAFALAQLPLLGRYLLLASTMLAIFAALAAFGWTALDQEHPLRRRWRLAGHLVLVVFAVFLPTQVERLDALRDDIARRDAVQADLRLLVDLPAAERTIGRCSPIFVPTHRPIPLIALWGDRRPAEIVSARQRRPSPQGALVAPATPVAESASILDPKDPVDPRLDRLVPRGSPGEPPDAYRARVDAYATGLGYRLVAENSSWVLYAGCGVDPG